MSGIGMIAEAGIGSPRDPERRCAIISRKWKRHRAAGRVHTGQVPQFTVETFEKLTLPDRIGIFRTRQREIDHGNARRFESRTCAPQITEALDQQSSSGEQQHRQRHLRNHEQCAQPMRLGTNRAAISFLERFVHVRPRDLQGRHHREQERAQNRCRKSECDDRSIDCDFVQPWKIMRAEQTQ